MSVRTDPEMLLAAQESLDEFGVFYRRQAERVLRYFATRTANAEVAADLMAETFASAFANLHTYRRRQEPPVAWLFTIARNLLIDAHRHAGGDRQGASAACLATGCLGRRRRQPDRRAREPAERGSDFQATSVPRSTRGSSKSGRTPRFRSNCAVPPRWCASV
jgi:DNA-directed RNA polymerase specialized sigma24 family protein